MQQRIGFSALLCTALSALACVAAGAQTSDTSRDNLPVVLLVEQRPAASQSQRDDLNIELKTSLREALNASGHFQTHSFLANESIIKRALNEHTIAAEDLVEPYKPEAMQRVARAIGARFILLFHASLDHNEMRTEMRYQENPNLSDWLQRVNDQITVPVMLGRRRLKPQEMVNVTVDAITSRIGYPSHLAASLQDAINTRVIYDPNKGKRKPVAKTTDKTQKPPDRETSSDTPDKISQAPAVDPQPAPQSIDPAPSPADNSREKHAKPAKNTSKPIKVATARTNTKTTPKATPSVTPSPGTPIVTPPVFTNQADPNSDPLPERPAISLPPAPARPDYEAQAARYRQTGDVANTISALRHAVNDRPRDIGLRRQLVTAYQAKQMPDAARAEATRALQLDPKNAALYRLYGEMLLAQGDTAGAMQAFRESARIEPNDIANQVALGDASLSDSKFAEAITAYQAAARTDPKSPLPHRRIGRAFAAMAETDTTQYGPSLAEISAARTLTPATDTQPYLEDYTALMRLVEGRIRKMLDELQAANQARVQTKKTPNDLLREAADLKLRGEALSDYLDKLPAAAGHDATQAHYQQANALLLQAVGFFKDVINKGDDRYVSSMKSAQVQAAHELTVASQRLIGVRPAVQDSGFTGGK